MLEATTDYYVKRMARNQALHYAAIVGPVMRRRRWIARMQQRAVLRRGIKLIYSGCGPALKGPPEGARLLHCNDTHDAKVSVVHPEQRVVASNLCHVNVPRLRRAWVTHVIDGRRHEAQLRRSNRLGARPGC